MEGDGCGGSEAARVGGASFDDLPEECLVKILSFNEPVDAHRLSSTSSSLRSAANSDALWETFLPSNYVSLVSTSATAPSFSSKKELFRWLCKPIVDDDGKKCFWLDKKNGRKSFMLSARDLSIRSSDNPQYWNWTHVHRNHSRFPEVAELKFAPFLDICGEISTHMISPQTTYSAFLVYKFHGNAFNCLTANTFNCLMVNTFMGVAGTEDFSTDVCISPNMYCWHSDQKNGTSLLRARCPKSRTDQWLEFELGQYFNGTGDRSELISIQVKGGWTKGGATIQGIEIRPMSFFVQ